MAANENNGSFPTNVTVLQYLLENDTAKSATKTNGLSDQSEAVADLSSASDELDESDFEEYENTERSNAEPVKVFECPVPDCNKVYLQQEHLKAHEKIHSGEFICKWVSGPDEQETSAAGSSGLKFLLENEDVELVYDEEDEDEAVLYGSDVESSNLLHTGLLEVESEDQSSSENELLSEDMSMSEVTTSNQLNNRDGNKLIRVFDAEVDTKNNLVVLEEDPEEHIYLNNQPMRISSKKARNFPCPWEGCEKTYTKSSHITVHMRTHTGDLPYVCSWEGCNMKFSRSESLSRHYRKHSDERNHICPHCPAKFLRSDHLFKHIKTHRPPEEMLEKQPAEEEIKQNKPKKPTSTKLSAISIRKANKSHLKQASPLNKTTERNFQCGFAGCTKSYTRASHLKAHEILHSESQPFRCPWEDCNQSFARSFELSRHRRQHTGEKKFVCHICQQAFARSDHLSMHVKRHIYTIKEDID
ncbi:zinc finger protein 420-like [Uranotaenia lowii]|uniref:zinc finger protein 420-like n=1 Tax=Uranotaenia lowii TaxID=190385 RepID=UPI0024787A4A|nr:zinc finger protein 420-like [Uranotaenia lowii]